MRKEIQELKRDIGSHFFESSIIIYDPEKGIPEFNDDKTRIFIPEDGRDVVRIYIPDNGRDSEIVK